MYTVRGVAQALTAAANHVICQLWNPHASQRIKVVQFGVIKRSAGTATDGFRLKRSTARGTPNSTVTPDIDNHSERAIAPVSGALLDLAVFSVQPTLSASELGPEFDALAGISTSLIYDIPGGLVIPPETGLAIAQISASVYPATVNFFIWYEDN